MIVQVDDVTPAADPLPGRLVGHTERERRTLEVQVARTPESPEEWATALAALTGRLEADGAAQAVCITREMPPEPLPVLAHSFAELLERLADGDPGPGITREIS